MCLAVGVHPHLGYISFHFFFVMFPASVSWLLKQDTVDIEEIDWPLPENLGRRLGPSAADKRAADASLAVGKVCEIKEAEYIRKKPAVEEEWMVSLD